MKHYKSVKQFKGKSYRKARSTPTLSIFNLFYRAFFLFSKFKFRGQRIIVKRSKIAEIVEKTKNSLLKPNSSTLTQ
jgi:hypothetical protein